MRLRTQFLLLILVAFVLGACALAVVVFNARVTEQLASEESRARILSREVSGLLAMTQQYVLFGEQRAEQQWRRRHRNLTNTLFPNEAATRDAGSEPEHAGQPFSPLATAGEILTRSQPQGPVQGNADHTDREFLPLGTFPAGDLPARLLLLRDMFDELVAQTARPNTGPLVQRRRELLIDRLITEMLDISEDTSAWEDRLSVERKSSERALIALAVAVPALLALMFAIGAVLLGRRVLTPIAELRAAMRKVADGNLNARCGSKERDEIGDLARSFDTMTSELQKRTIELHESDSWLRTIADHLPARIGYVDVDLNYRFANTACCEFLGLAPEAVIGRSLRAVRGEETYAAMAPNVEAALRGELRRFEMVERRGTELRQFETTFIPDLHGAGVARGVYFMIFDITERQREQARVAFALSEKETLLKEVYHRVKNNLQVMQSLLNLQMRALPKGAARDVIGETTNRIRAMALVHEKLYQSGNLAAVDLPQYVTDLFRQLSQATASDSRGVRLLAEIDPIQLTLEDAVPMGLLLTELISNSLKHAFPGGLEGEVRVTLRKEPCAAGAELRVTDNGVGLPDNFDINKGSSMGLKLIGSLSRQLGGTPEFHSDRGTTFVLPLPELVG